MNNGKMSGIPEAAPHRKGCREEGAVCLCVARPLLCPQPPGEHQDQHTTSRPYSFLGALIPSSDTGDFTFLLCFEPLTYLQIR